MGSPEGLRTLPRKTRMRRSIAALSIVATLGVGGIGCGAPSFDGRPTPPADSSTSAPVVDAPSPSESKTITPPSKSATPTPERTAEQSTFKSSIEPINSALKQQMIEGKTWREGCPVKLENLSYISVSYWGFDGKQHQGELVMHKNVAPKIVDVMHKLYDVKFPIEKMVLPSNAKYNGVDEKSMADNNTSGFSCREDEEGDYGQHAYGKAIDINPLINPMVYKDGTADPPAGKPYANRSTGQQGMITRGNAQGKAVIAAFEGIGWSWGGDWDSFKDYQHFSENGN